VFLKKINEYIEPAKGFNVIATANTKGKGSDDGRFIGTNVLNEAFLERFPITFEQSYPTVKIEQNIVLKVFESLGIKDKEFAENLVKWADVIRKTFYDGGIDEIISTRRLVHIANAYAIFNNKMKAIQVCTNRFDEDTKNSFLDLYTKVDAGEDLSQLNQTEEPVSNDSEENEQY
jgi:cobaltochelatase CobS